MTWEHRLYRELGGRAGYRAGVIVLYRSTDWALPVERARLPLPGLFSRDPVIEADEWERACAEGHERAARWVRDYERGGARREKALREAREGAR